MSSSNFDAADLRTAGAINEDVMQKIFDISPVETPFFDRIGSETSSNQYKEWTLDSLGNPEFGNAVIDGADASTDQSVATSRVGNHHQISDKVVRVSGRAQAVNTIGRSNELAYQLLQRGKELRIDLEAIALGNQASVADNGSNTAGKTGTVPSWLTTNTSRGATTGADGGFAAGVVAIATPGDARALTETMLRDMIESCYTSGGDPSTIMSVPKMKRRISEYLFSSSARVGTITTDTGQKREQSVAVGAVDVFVSDFGALEIIPNRQQLDYNSQATYGAANIVDVFILDWKYWAVSYLRGFRTVPLAKNGDADNRQMLVDWTIISKNEGASAVIADINSTSAMTAS